jgi:hypothetical protein
MKKIFFFISLVIAVSLTWYGISKLIRPHDYRRDSRHFYCLENGRCVTVWRTLSGICYVIPGKYSNSVCPPPSQSYITSTFTKGMDIIWEKNTDNIIVNLEDEKSQIIHESQNGIKIVNYNLNKKYNDSVFLYFDGNYNHFKKEVDFMDIDIKEEHANGNDTVKDYGQ